MRRADPLDLDPVARLLDPIDTATLAGLRDRALLLIAFDVRCAEEPRETR